MKYLLALLFPLISLCCWSQTHSKESLDNSGKKSFDTSSLLKLVTSNNKEYYTYFAIMDRIEDVEDTYPVRLSLYPHDIERFGKKFFQLYLLSQNVQVKELRRALEDLGFKTLDDDTLWYNGVFPINEALPAYVTNSVKLYAERKNGRLCVSYKSLDKESIEVLNNQEKKRELLHNITDIATLQNAKDRMYEVVTDDGNVFYTLDFLADYAKERQSMRRHRVKRLPQKYQHLVWEPTEEVKLKPGVKVMTMEESLAQKGITVNAGDTIIYHNYTRVSKELPGLITSGVVYNAKKTGNIIRIAIPPFETLDTPPEPMRWEKGARIM